MTNARSEAQKRRHKREANDICPACSGRGTVVAKNVHTRAKQGGNANYRASLKPGGRAMGDRNQGAKPDPTLAEMRKRDAENKKEDSVGTPASHLFETKIEAIENAALAHSRFSPANRIQSLRASRRA